MDVRLTPGDRAPDLNLADQHGEMLSLGDYLGRKVCVYFYPKADTPGCTLQSCSLRDLQPQLGDTVIIGVSPDTSAKQAKFDAKYSLGFALLADVDHVASEAYGVWRVKSMYGRTYMGIERSAFLIDANGLIEQAWYKVSPKDTPIKLLESLGISGQA